MQCFERAKYNCTDFHLIYPLNKNLRDGRTSCRSDFQVYIKVSEFTRFGVFTPKSATLAKIAYLQENFVTIK